MERMLQKQNHISQLSSPDNSQIACVMQVLNFKEIERL